MRYCDICGKAISDKHPFAVCPRCLFEPALDPGTGSGTQASDQAPSFTLAGVTGLFPRRDFCQKYEILERIGEGGQGDVWKVWDFELRRHVAMKRLSEKASESEPAVYRFLAEAQITSQLEHPGILPIFDVGLDLDNRPFFTTSLLPGMTLDDVWRQLHKSVKGEQSSGPWTFARALDLLARVCDVMAHAHSRGVIHRDLKPANVLVGAFGEVRVVDWDSAYVMAGEHKRFEGAFVPLNRDTIQTDRGEAIWADPASPLATAVAGRPITVLFAAPENLAGQHDELGPPTDVYSLGVMLYELLALRLPYSNPDGSLPSIAKLQELIRHGSPTAVRQVRPAVSRDLAAICDKAMAHQRNSRYQSMQELSDELRAVLEIRPVKARKPGPILRMQKWALRNVSHVLALGAVLVISSAAFFATRAFKADRDAARQFTELRGAELAARSGRWRDALHDLDLAEADGFHDGIYLQLQRAEAWTVLNEPQRAQAALARLMHRSDLGNQRGLVLLRMGEHELFDQETSDRGVHHITEAMAAGLTSADEAFAKGLLAQSSPEALSLFRQALASNPYHHGAHVHTMGLEFLLGRHQELETESHIFKTLYPEDPSPTFLEAMELASEGRLADAQTRLASLARAASPDMLKRLESGCQQMAAAAKYYDVNTFLVSPRTNLGELGIEMAPMFFSNDLPGSTNPKEAVRIPQLPCVKQGMIEGFTAVRSLMIPFLSDPQTAVQKIKSGWQHHPEALMPALAGMFLERRQPREGSKSIPLLSMQAALFQMAADSPSILPNLPRLARYLAAKSQFDLARSRQPAPVDAAHACLENARRACAADQCPAAELAAYYDFAFTLQDYDLARELLVKWERRLPKNILVIHKRVELDLAVGALGAALERLDQILVQNPADSWALAQKQIVVGQIKALTESVQHP